MLSCRLEFSIFKPRHFFQAWLMQMAQASVRLRFYIRSAVPTAGEQRRAPLISLERDVGFTFEPGY